MLGKLLRFGLGTTVGLVGGLAAYKTYQKAEEDLRRHLVETVREAYADQEIDVVWIFDEPVREGVFGGGLKMRNRMIYYEIEEKSLQVYELDQTSEQEESLGEGQ